MISGQMKRNFEKIKGGFFSQNGVSYETQEQFSQINNRLGDIRGSLEPYLTNCMRKNGLQLMHKGSCDPYLISLIYRR